MELLRKAELLDGYRRSCKNNFLNNLARSTHEYVAISSSVQQKAEEYIKTLSFAPPQTHVVTLHPSADNGYPHTRPGNLICVPTFSIPPSEETLRHEALHLHQRLNEGAWITYSISQGWWPIPPALLPSEWTERCRINPDTMMSPFWSWQNNYVPLPIFTNEWSPSLGDCSIRWFDLRNRVLFTKPPDSFEKRYGPIGQPEHPFETGAIEFSHHEKLTHTSLMNSLSTE